MAAANFKIFEFVKLFEVEKGSPAVGGERPTHSFDSQSSSIVIEQACWRESSGRSVLVLVCSNGYLVIRVASSGAAPVIKQLKWFESRQQHILDVTLDPYGEWLACACLDGAVYLMPILSLMLNCQPSYNFGASLNDITVIEPSNKKASPTCIVWWQTMDENYICITGSEVGEVTFFDLAVQSDVATLYVGSCITSLMVAHQTDASTHLLVGLRGGDWKRLLLEEHYHEAAGASYTEAQASGFEVLPDDMVIKSFLHKAEPVDEFEMKQFPSFSELTRLSTHDWKNQHFLSALNLRSFKMEVYSYDFELMPTPVKAYHLVTGATNALLTDRMMFVISHNDEETPCTFTLTLMSTQRATVTEMIQDGQSVSQTGAIIQTFNVPSQSNLVGFFSTVQKSHDLAMSSHDALVPPSELGGCLIVTSSCVYQCRQRLSPEALFLDYALRSKSHDKAQEFGITFKLDVCGLYQIAAEKKLVEGEFKLALKLFELSRCSPQHVIDRFAEHCHLPQLVQYLHQLVYDDSGHASLANPKAVQDTLFKCFVFQCLKQYNTPDGALMLDKFSQFINDKFLYNQTTAMDLLLQCGLKTHLFELAKTHHKLSDVLQLLVQNGSMEIEASIQSSLASRQYVETLSQEANGLFLYQMSPPTFVRLLNAMPSIIPAHLPYLRTLLPKLDIATLLRLARLCDPSQSPIRPLLIKAHSNRPRSNSTGSLVSTVSGGEGGGGGGGGGGGQRGPRLEEYVELFLSLLVILNQRRRQKPTTSKDLLSLSPLRSAVSGSLDQSAAKCPGSYAEGSQWVRGSTVSCGLHHAAVVAGGNLYTWGSTKNGKLGHGEIEDAGKAAPLRVETMNMLSIHVVSVSCGAEHTVALCQEGVFSWGSSSHGQLGHGDTLKKSRPVQIATLADKSIVSIACGQYHTLALDDDQRVWSWGWGLHGQLGLATMDDRQAPSHASLLDACHVSFIAAGYGHSAVLTAEGEVLTFGNGMYGQLGHGSTEKQPVPKRVAALEGERLYLLACGNFHTVVVSTKQCVYFWGKNLHRPRPSAGGAATGLKEYKRSRERQETLTGSFSNLTFPQSLPELQLDSTIMQVSCGSFHSLLLTSSGAVYSWGSNDHGQLGHPHTAELTKPRVINDFEGHKVVAIASGDEFCVVVDDRGSPWAWGRAGNGQLGLTGVSTSEGPREAFFKPRKVTSITAASDSERRTRDTSPEGSELPVLELDLGWHLPDFATIDTPNAPYGREALDVALDHLHGFYRTTVLLWRCRDWGDHESMAKIYNIERQWAQALSCSLSTLNMADTTKALSLAENYIKRFISGNTNYHAPQFVGEGLTLLENLLDGWAKHGLQYPELEELLTNHIPCLSYPLSIILRSSSPAPFSLSFHLAVAGEVMVALSAGEDPPEAVLKMAALPDASLADQTQTGDEKPHRLVTETSIGDQRLWMEVLRNLSKDLLKQNAIALSEAAIERLSKASSLLGGAAGDDKGGQARLIGDGGVSNRREEGEGGGGAVDFVAFSCGHAFLREHFTARILMEFTERVQDFPLPLPQTLKHLQFHYKQSRRFPSGCPYCVFQYLRKLQLQECPGVPIKPWKP